MTLFANFMRNHCKESCERQPWATDHGLNSVFMNSDFVESLRFVLLDVNSGFIGWLKEMAANKRSFAPFDLDVDDPIKFVRGKEMKYGILAKKGYSLFDHELNSESRVKANANLSKEQKLMEFFYAATSKIMSEKYNF